MSDPFRLPEPGWNLPYGVSPNDPHLTGEWPCEACGGAGYDEDEDGKHACPHCNGSGIEPEPEDEPDDEEED